MGQPDRRARRGRREKLAFIAATTFALEAVLDLSAQMADEDRNDIRIEAALAKLYGLRDGAGGSPTSWSRSAAAAATRPPTRCAARGERAVPAEQMLRDMRINRIFEGSTEIMHLLIAREAVDAHLSVAGDLIDPDAELEDKAKAGAQGARGFYAKWLPAAGRRARANCPRLRRVRRRWPGTCASSSGPRASWPARTFYAMSRWQAQAGVPKQDFLGRIVDIGAELFAMSAACVRAEHLAATGAHGADAR